MHLSNGCSIKEAPKLMKTHFKRIKLRKSIMQIKPLIKNCFVERVQKPNNILGKFPLGEKLLNIKEKGSENNRKSREAEFFLNSWQNFNNSKHG